VPHPQKSNVLVATKEHHPTREKRVRKCLNCVRRPDEKQKRNNSVLVMKDFKMNRKSNARKGRETE